MTKKRANSTHLSGKRSSHRKRSKPVPQAILRNYRKLFGGKVPAEAMKLIRREYAKNPAGAFERCVKQVTAKGSAFSPRGVCAASGRAKYGAKKFQAMAAAGRKRSGKRKRKNPVEAAASTYRGFHGKDPAEIIEVETPIHFHSVLAGVGKLVRLVIAAVDGRTEVVLEQFGGALLAQNEKRSKDERTQLYIEGGNQSVNLSDFGITSPVHEQELLGAITDIVYHTEKRHLRPEDGGKADYDHGFGTTRKGERHVRIKGARLPVAIYDTRNKLLSIAGGTYTIEDLGING